MGQLTFNYSESTQKMVGQVLTGIRVETPVLTTLATYWTNAVDYQIFDVVGLIKVYAMYMEVTGVFTTHATTLAFRWDGTTPSEAIATMGSASATLSDSPVGTRAMFLGPGQVIAGPHPEISYLPAPFLIGGVTGAGVNCIGVVNALIGGATLGAGSSGRYVLHYAAMSEGAYAASAI